MNISVVFLFAALALSTVGVLVLWLIARPSSRYDSGIRSFSREMEALSRRHAVVDVRRSPAHQTIRSTRAPSRPVRQAHLGRTSEER